jgi:hypothetical protein
MQYAHTQRGYFHLLLYLVAAACLPLAWALGNEPVGLGIVLATVVLLLVCGLAFHWMTIEDEGDRLAIRYGPLPLLGKRIPYEQITGVEAGRTMLLDGWGIHYLPGRGWTYNLWGFDCVVVHLGPKTLRLGTDDVAGLLGFLQNKVGAAGPAA